MNTTNPTQNGERAPEAREMAQIRNCKRNIMGTVSFDGKFSGMRNPQDFIVYPMQDSGPNITIQSDHRFGQIDLETGKGVLSANRAQYANAPWLGLCVINRTAIDVELATEDRETLRQWIKSTGGIEVGASFVKCDNTGALAL
jgi:hypothetical protein